jgi:predicted flap endonuclease-1-like 5' DNA nuclease
MKRHLHDRIRLVVANSNDRSRISTGDSAACCCFDMAARYAYEESKMNSPDATIEIDDEPGGRHEKSSDQVTVRELFRASLRLGEMTLDFAERQAAAVLGRAEEFRDDVVPSDLMDNTRQEGLASRVRADSHRAVDLAFDLSVRLMDATTDGLNRLANTVESSVSSVTTRTEKRHGDLERIEGIGPAYARQLNKAGIFTCDELLAAGATRQGRQALVEETDISEKRLLTWINMVDLFRVKGIDSEYAELLEAAGVDSVPELAQRNPESLHQKLAEVNDSKNLVRRLPGISEVGDWVAQAKKLPRVVTH